MVEAEQLHPSGVEGLVSFWEYEGVVKKLIAEAKYEYYFDQLRDLTDMSLLLLEREEFDLFREFLGMRPVVVPVPLFKKRERTRGFNQAEIIGNQIAKRLNLETRKMLERVVDTGQQVGRSREERLQSMKNAFTSPQPLSLSSERGVLLVDDVWTTGATMSECARVLGRAGAVRVWGLVLAR